MPRRIPYLRFRDHLADLIAGEEGPVPDSVTGACSDSRTVEPGWVFCAIAGASDDGRRYIADAVKAGASVVVGEDVSPVPGVRTVRVTDAYAAAGRVAEIVHGMPAEELRLYGITGTNGKTTCAYLLREMARAAGRPCGMIGTVCYAVGDRELPADRTTPTPFDLQGLLRQMADARVEDAILEVSSHSLVQHRAGTARFRGALFTNLTGDHLDYHGTMEAYYEAKKILFAEYLAGDGVAVINADDAYGRRLAEELRAAGRHRVVTFGAGNGDVRIVAPELSLSGIRFRLEAAGGGHAVTSPLIGMHNVYNAAGAFLLAVEGGMDPGGCALAALRTCAGAPGRLQAISGPGGRVAYVDYAHTDDALENVLTALRGLNPRRLIVVFGCGGDRDRTKRPRMGRVAARLADRVYVTSDNPRSEDPEFILREIMAGIPPGTDAVAIADRRSAIRAALREAVPGEVVLVAGKGHEAYQEIRGRRYPFDDAAEVALAFGEGPSAST